VTGDTENLDQQFDEAIQALSKFYVGKSQTLAEYLVIAIHDAADDGTLRRLIADIHLHLETLDNIINHTY
jgi:hypothetical protein